MGDVFLRVSALGWLHRQTGEFTMNRKLDHGFPSDSLVLLLDNAFCVTAIFHLA